MIFYRICLHDSLLISIFAKNNLFIHSYLFLSSQESDGGESGRRRLIFFKWIGIQA